MVDTATTGGLLDPELDRLAGRFVTAVEDGDIATIREHIYAPDAVIWHNTDNRAITTEENFETLRWLSETVSGLRYEDITRRPVPDGYVQQHVLRGTTPDGASLEIRACFIVTIRNGRIVRLDEYLDTAHSAALSPYRPSRKSV